ncbi:MAG: ParB/RepB/Spo0J family partition protein [Lachnospiraceae bacterium]|nr:ParB/RepB/Spo0J family partition protein [Lachnospiraceae bacterium]
MSNVKEISINNLRNHPNNVRRSYTGIAELAASISENGVLQNLTVVPDPENDGKYLVVIGNRRLQAAIKAGLKKVPCVVSDMSEADQALTMLTENMQRNDLTPLEESDGFQMCLEDFGIDVGTLAQKTGFSKSTVRHRLNIAKLDREVVQEKISDKEFQLTITDLIRLEKVKDIDRRNSILSDSGSSRDLVWKIEQAVQEESRKKIANRLVSLAKKESIPEAPDDVISHHYYYPWRTLLTLTLEGDVPDQLLDEETLEKFSEEIYYIVTPQAFKVVGKVVELKTVDSVEADGTDTALHDNTDSDYLSGDGSSSAVSAEVADDSPADTDEGPSLEELRENDRAARFDECEELTADMLSEINDFCRLMIDGKIEEPDDEMAFTVSCWNMLMRLSSTVSLDLVASYVFGKPYYKVSEDERLYISELPVYTQMISIISKHFDGYSLMDYYTEYLENRGRDLQEFHSLLSMLGFSFSSNEYDDLMNGTHRVYVPVYAEDESADDSEPTESQEDTVSDGIGDNEDSDTGELAEAA